MPPFFLASTIRMIERFNLNNKNHVTAMRRLPFSYMSSVFTLAMSAYVIERNGENIIVLQDLLSPHEIPTLSLPKNKKNWQWLALTFATEKDVQALEENGNEILVKNPLSTEFFYKTDQFVHPTGSFQKKIRAFENKHSFRVFHTYSKKEITSFYEQWKTQVHDESITFDESETLFFYVLDRLDLFEVKQVYVEIDGVLAGLAWGAPHWSGGWVGMHLKTDYQYRDLSRFLHHERAKCFADRENFTLGTDVFREGVRQYKQELHPFEQRPYFYVMTGGGVQKK